MSIAYVPNTAKKSPKNEPLLETKIQELEQIRQNLLSNTDCSDGLAKAYQQMAIEIVEACQEVLRTALKAEVSKK